MSAAWPLLGHCPVLWTSARIDCVDFAVVLEPFSSMEVYCGSMRDRNKLGHELNAARAEFRVRTVWYIQGPGRFIDENGSSITTKSTQSTRALVQSTGQCPGKG